MHASTLEQYRNCIEKRLCNCKQKEIIFIEYKEIARAFPSSKTDLDLARASPYANVREIKPWAKKLGFEVIWKAPIAESYEALPFGFKRTNAV